MRPLWLPLLFAMSCVAPGPPELGDRELAPVDPRTNTLVTLNGYHPWTPPTTLDEWTVEREEALTQLRVAVGLELMPPRPTPASHERLIAEREGYSVSAIRIESLPGHWVTGNLYRPEGDGPFPAVLCPHGHWPEGRFTDRENLVEKELESGGEIDPVAARYHLQARSVHLARMGCLVLHYDMVGYADATALGHTSGLTSVEAQGFGVNHLGLQSWNSIRLVDHLVSRSDVDPSRIGVTGGSGGGTQSFMLAALDERIRVAFPAVMVGTEMQGGCVCENAPHLRVGTSNIGICALVAPRALGMTGADDWTLHIEERGLPELKQVWGLYDRADAVEADRPVTLVATLGSDTTTTQSAARRCTPSSRDTLSWERSLRSRPLRPSHRPNSPSTRRAMTAHRSWMLRESWPGGARTSRPPSTRARCTTRRASRRGRVM